MAELAGAARPPAAVPAAWATGEAAGTAATMAVQDGVSVKEIGVQQLQQRLRRQGAFLE